MKLMRMSWVGNENRLDLWILLIAKLDFLLNLKNSLTAPNVCLKLEQCGLWDLAESRGSMHVLWDRVVSLGRGRDVYLSVL